MRQAAIPALLGAMALFPMGCDTADEMNDDGSAAPMGAADKEVTGDSSALSTRTFKESSGMVVMEAEHFHSDTAQGGHTFDLTAVGSASGGAVMTANPNSGTTVNTGYMTDSPRLDFNVSFSTTGTYYVWVRGFGASPTDRTVHTGIDGLATSTADRLSGFSATLQWSKSTLDWITARVSVTAAGVRTINIWMREDGFNVDKIVLTTNAGYTPAGTGPEESPQQGGCTIPGDCDDGNVCTDDVCTSGVCSYTADAASCDDGNSCTTLDTCSLSVCSGIPVVCDDGDPCTDDDCESGTCVFSDNGTCPAGCTPKTYTFQRGLDNYTGVTDIEIREQYPTTSYAARTTLTVDTQYVNGNAATETQVLVMFAGLFGDGEKQIPLDAEIEGADLTVYATNSTTNNVSMHRMLADWTAASTWSSLGDGVTADDTEAVSAADDMLTAPGAGAFFSFDATDAIAAWQADPDSNRGFVLFNSGSDGWVFNASENATAAQRPMLTVDVCECPDTPPVLNAPADGYSGVATSPLLDVTVFGNEGSTLDVSFYGRVKAPRPWTLIALPDTQNYSQSYPSIFTSQTQWIVDKQETLNIKMVVNEGDIVNTWNSQAQWNTADASLSLLIDEGIPLSLVPGNHDHQNYTTSGSTYYFSNTFPASRFEGFDWWGEDYNNNNSNYVTLTIGNEDYLFMGLDFCPSSDEIDWADDVLDAYPDHKAILTTHGYITDNTGAYSVTNCSDTSYIFDDLVALHDNLQLVLCGHMHNSDGEYHRAVTKANGVIVHELIADYQGRTGGGNGLLRIMTFDPDNDEIRVETFSPYTGSYETDADSRFTFPYEMEGGDPFAVIGTVSGPADGAHATQSWSGLTPQTAYEWYVTVSDGIETIVGPVWEFTTGP